MKKKAAKTVPTVGTEYESKFKWPLFFYNPIAKRINF